MTMLMDPGVKMGDHQLNILNLYYQKETWR